MIDLFSMTTDNLLVSEFPVVSPGTTNSEEKVYTLTAAGYYGIKFSYTTDAGSTSYQSLSYNCPLSAGFTDSSCVF